MGTLIRGAGILVQATVGWACLSCFQAIGLKVLDRRRAGADDRRNERLNGGGEGS